MPKLEEYIVGDLIYYRDNDHMHHWNEGGIIAHKRLHIIIVCIKIIRLKLKCFPVSVNLIRAYAPKTDKIWDQNKKNYAQLR